MLRTIASMCLLILLASPTMMFGQADFIFVGGNVLTADSGQPTVEAVALAGERIRAVGSNKEIQRLAGAKTRVINLRGRTVIPGLMDAHVHLLVGSMIVDEPSLRNYERIVLPKLMAGFIRHGITTIRSTADPLPYIAQIRDRLERDELMGPRLLITGPTPTSPGSHPATTVCKNNPFCRQGATREVDNEEQARQLARELVRAKVDAIKVTLENRIAGVSGVPLLSDALVAALVDEVHRSGRRIIAHAPITKHYAEIGFDEFVHMTINAAEASQIAGVLVARKITVTTTLSIWDAYRDATGAERVIWGVPYGPGWRQGLEGALKATSSFADAGVKLVVGTDWNDGADWARSDDVRLNDPRLLPGALTLHEMELLRRAGLTTTAILTAATRSAAEALGIIDKVGTIAEGKLADLVILDGDLLQDFSALRRTVAVIKSGRVVHGALPNR
jgi:imidazolonepropionase-like amidohydrolase